MLAPRRRSIPLSLAHNKSYGPKTETAENAPGRDTTGALVLPNGGVNTFKPLLVATYILPVVSNASAFVAPPLGSAVPITNAGVMEVVNGGL